VVANPELKIDVKTDFADQSNGQQLLEALQKAGLKGELEVDEEHGAWMVTYHDSTNAPRSIGYELASLPEYRKLRSLARQLARYNQPPFVVPKTRRGTRWRAGRNCWNTSRRKARGTSTCNAIRGWAR
jgi:hypothetical protein